MDKLNLHSLWLLLLTNAVLRLISVNLFGIRVGRGTWIKSKTVIGKGTGIGWNFCVRGSGTLWVGKYCAIGENVRVITSNHDFSCLATNFYLQDDLIQKRLIGNKLDVTIGNDVWIGDQAIILPGVAIADGTVVGAGAVVSRTFEPYSIIAGNPARQIGSRFDKASVAKAVSLGWWNWSKSEMLSKRNLFESDFPSKEIK